MQEEVKYALNKFSDAFARLKEGVSEAQTELDKDGVIQRFEFSFELFWKSIKIYLGNEGIECRTPRESLKSAFKIGLIENETVFLDMLEDRNKTSHIYDKEESEKIFERIKSEYLGNLENILASLKERITNTN